MSHFSLVLGVDRGEPVGLPITMASRVLDFLVYHHGQWLHSVLFLWCVILLCLFVLMFGATSDLVEQSEFSLFCSIHY
jgi:hypothetical protein